MNSGEYSIMERLEEDHWWYLGLRDLIGRSIRESLLTSGTQHYSVLDAGCGTGANLRYLSQILQTSYLGGFDVAQEAVQAARKKAPSADVYISDLCAPELRAEWFDLVLSCDVLYVPGIERGAGGLKQIASRIRPGGLLILNLPAFEWLRSEHDLAIHTTERYTKQQVIPMIESMGMKIEWMTYRLFFLFPILLLKRLPTILWPQKDRTKARSDLIQHSRWVNQMLYRSIWAENCCIQYGVRFPVGSSLYVVARKY